jgi:hypothetical protein
LAGLFSPVSLAASNGRSAPRGLPYQLATLTLHTAIAKNGKTFTRTTEGTDAEGKPVDSVAVFEKQ